MLGGDSPWWSSPPRASGAPAATPAAGAAEATEKLIAELSAGACSAVRVRQLLTLGARCYVAGAQHDPALQPLHIACASALLEPGCALAMLESGAEPNGDGGYGGYGGAAAVSHTTGRHCCYPITAAARRGSLPLVRALIDHGASVNPVGADRGPLFWAVALGHEEVCEVLLLAGAMLDCGAGSGSGGGDACLPQASVQLALVVGELHIAKLLCSMEDAGGGGGGGGGGGSSSRANSAFERELGRRLRCEVDEAYARVEYSWLTRLRIEISESSAAAAAAAQQQQQQQQGGRSRAGSAGEDYERYIHGDSVASGSDNGSGGAASDGAKDAASVAHAALVLRLLGPGGGAAKVSAAGGGEAYDIFTDPARLFWAQPGTVAELIRWGADAAADPAVLVAAARGGHTMCAEVLLAAGADPTAREEADGLRRGGGTALHAAAAAGHAAAAMALRSAMVRAADGASATAGGGGAGQQQQQQQLSAGLLFLDEEERTPADCAAANGHMVLAAQLRPPPDAGQEDGKHGGREPREAIATAETVAVAAAATAAVTTDPKPAAVREVAGVSAAAMAAAAAAAAAVMDIGGAAQQAPAVSPSASHAPPLAPPTAAAGTTAALRGPLPAAAAAAAAAASPLASAAGYFRFVSRVLRPARYGGAAALPRPPICHVPVHFGICGPGDHVSRLVCVTNEHGSLPLCVDATAGQGGAVAARSGGSWRIRGASQGYGGGYLWPDGGVDAVALEVAMAPEAAAPATNAATAQAKAQLQPLALCRPLSGDHAGQLFVPPRSRAVLLVEFSCGRGNGGGSPTAGAAEAGALGAEPSAAWGLKSEMTGARRGMLALRFGSADDAPRLSLCPLLLPLCVRVGRVQVTVRAKDDPAAAEQDDDAAGESSTALAFRAEAGKSEWRAIELHNTGSLPLVAHCDVQLEASASASPGAMLPAWAMGAPGATVSFSVQPPVVRLLPRAKCDVLVLFAPRHAGKVHEVLRVRSAPDANMLPGA